MPKEALIVMISSTAIDLPDYRDALRSVCSSLDLIPRMMEDLAAGPDTLEKSLAMVDEADIYVGIFAHRYGSIPDGHNKSFTELELDRALDRGIEILNFLMADNQPILHKDVEKGAGAEKLEALKDKIKNLRKITGKFTSVESLKDQVRQSLTEAKARLAGELNGIRSATLDDAERDANASTPEYDSTFPCFNVPFRSKGDGVIGRDGVLGKIHDALHGDVHTPFGKLVALVGLGGLGKTQLAVEYAYRFREKYPGGVVWLGANEDIDSQLTTLSEESKWVSPFSDHKTKLDVALKRVRSRSDCLIIFDNLEDFDHIRPYLPRIDATPHLLLTSQWEVPGVPSIEVDFLDADDSLSLLIREAGEFPPEESKIAVDEILTHLDGLPLALEMAGAYVRRLHYDWHTYLDHLRERPRRSLRGTSLGSFTNHDPDVFATLRVSERILDDEAHLRSAVDILTWSGATDMGVALLSFLVGCEESDLVTELLPAVNVRLVRKHPFQHRYSLHRLVQLARRENSDREAFNNWFVEVGNRLGNWFESRREDFSHLATFELEFDHLVAWQRFSKPISNVLSARLMWLQSYPSFHRGDFQRAQDLIFSAKSILSTEKNMNPLLMAHIDSDFGFTCTALGRYDQALEETRKALEIRIEILGEDHPDTARSYGNLGAIYTETGKFDLSLPLEQKALEIQLKINGEFHQDTARAFGNLGGTFFNLSRHDEALPLRRKALEILKAVHGKNHPDTARAIGNLGALYGAIGDLDAQLKHSQDALDIRRATLGEDHPETATAFVNLGTAYGALGKHEIALEYKTRALEIRRNNHGEDHPDMATAYGNLGATYFDLGALNEALEFEQKALDICLATIGESHHDTATAFGNLATTLSALGRHVEALEMEQRALAIRCAIFGEEHPETALSYKNLGAKYNAARKYNKALNFAQRAHEIYERNFGDVSDKTRWSAVDVGIALGNLNRPVEARVALLKAVHGLAKSHPISVKAKQIAKTLSREVARRGERFTPPKRPRKKRR